MKICNARPDCPTPARIGPLCRRHATDLAEGKPFRPPLLRPSPSELRGLEGQRLVNRLMRYTRKDPITLCRHWTGARDGAGYSCLTMYDPAVGRNRSFRTYRVIVEALTGPIPEGYHVHHTCSTPDCVSPDHLQRSDARENIGEMLARNSYLRYIHALRSALADHDPTHWLLASRIETFDGTPDTPKDS